jgi:putative transposase
VRHEHVHPAGPGRRGTGDLDPAPDRCECGIRGGTQRQGQYTSLRYGERLAEAAITPSVGSVGDSYHNALAETINGLYKTELIKLFGPWKGIDAVEYATAEWVDWFNHRRLYEYCGDIAPTELEAAYYAHEPPQPAG